MIVKHFDITSINLDLIANGVAISGEAKRTNVDQLVPFSNSGYIYKLINNQSIVICSEILLLTKCWDKKTPTTLI